MKLYATSDLHLDYADNWRGLTRLPHHPNDWLIVAGDVCHTEIKFAETMQLLSDRFAQLFWTPGNHDLWSWPPNKATAKRGMAKYNELVRICRDYGVLTPEDPYAKWPGPGPTRFIAPIFTLYDYTFRPDTVPVETAVDWAAATEVVCADEYLLHPDPFPSRPAWCHARIHYTKSRLDAVADKGRLILTSHFPLRQAHAITPRIPRFSIWCGTRQTDKWPQKYPVDAVVYGHLHIRMSREQEGVRYEEVSLGYPKQWTHSRGMHTYFRQIL